MKHTTATPTEQELTERRLALLEEQLADLSRKHIVLGRESRARAAIIRRRNAQLLLASELVRRQVLAYLALSRVRDRLRPAPDPIDTGTPGVYAAVTR
ncbi:hypothetical protein V2S66_03095 [Streptomyces sp. V4-01]|uniref:50S ribosomal protein L29 n=1 Tax=Actinacidiphila polyblastidii TaxID=3110430 RepID=A0ABU7P563_9ACTN|nr:hypothetical protein [Streptomyces sp. V4-01]